MAKKILSISQSLKIAAEMTDKKRKNLVEKISENNYLRLCRLGYITEGATIDDRNNRVPVWRLTDRADIFLKEPDVQNVPQYIENRVSALLKLHKYL